MFELLSIAAYGTQWLIPQSNTQLKTVQNQ